ncbi:MAG: CPBP family intramembrane metalloprotease [Chloroflexi bacterium]|nr:CPBP family intramembrane metalloprotease [Chloroflexota bacterium]
MRPYLDAALDGKNDWWRYALGYLFILACYLILGSIPVLALALFAMLDGNPLTNLSLTGVFTGISPVITFVVLMSSFIPFFIAEVATVTLIHRRPFRSLITTAARVDWKRVWQGAGIWLLVAALISLVEALLYPGRYVFSFDAKNWIAIAVASLILIPIQSSAEEFLFRGYLLQHAGLKVKNVVALSLLSGFLFTLPHLGNPEVIEMGALMTVFYFVTGVFLAVITLKDNGLELALGMHASNNIFSSLFASYTNDAIQTPALFTIGEFDMTFNLITLFVGVVLFYLLAFKVWPKKQPAQPEL